MEFSVAEPTNHESIDKHGLDEEHASADDVAQPVGGLLMVVLSFAATATAAAGDDFRDSDRSHALTMLRDVRKSIEENYFDAGLKGVDFGALADTAKNRIDDGRLEKKGVAPDFKTLPTAEDLAAGRDPALAQALQFAGQNFDPAQAGALLPKR